MLDYYLHKEPVLKGCFKVFIQRRKTSSTSHGSVPGTRCASIGEPKQSSALSWCLLIKVMSPAPSMQKDLQGMAVHTEELARLKAHRWQVSSLVFRSDGHWLATAGWDKEVHIWDLNNLEVYCTLKGVHKVPITDLSWQKPAGQLLCTCSADHTAVLWNVETGEHVRTLTGHSGWVLGSCFSSSGSVLATASWDSSIAIWDTCTGEHINSYTDHTKGVWAVDFHPHSSFVLCSANEDGTVKIWDLREGKVARTLSSGSYDAVCCAKWSPDGTMIASGSADTKVRQSQLT